MQPRTMNTELWAEHLRQRLAKKLADVQNGDLKTAITENLSVVLEGVLNDWTPEQTATRIHSIELATLGTPRQLTLPE